MISEAPTGSQVHTVVGIDFAAVSRFNVGVEVQILRGVEVGAEAVFIPSAAKILRETSAMALERIGVARLSLPIDSLDVARIGRDVELVVDFSVPSRNAPLSNSFVT